MTTARNAVHVINIQFVLNLITYKYTVVLSRQQFSNSRISIVLLQHINEPPEQHSAETKEIKDINCGLFPAETQKPWIVVQVIFL